MCYHLLPICPEANLPQNMLHPLSHRDTGRDEARKGGRIRGRGLETDGQSGRTQVKVGETGDEGDGER